MKKKVLSLFNGMNCIGLALKEMGVDFELYASEIDKYANQVSSALFPETINLGNVRLVRIAMTYSSKDYKRFVQLLKAVAGLDHKAENQLQWLESIKYIKFDLVVAGSPCQGFSFAGKQLNFNDSRSKLFFDFVQILEACKKNNPGIKFLLENVKMKKQYEDIISKYMNIPPIQINSSLVSAQNRVRLYWTNIGTTKANLFGIQEPGIKQPSDKGILLEDILEENVDEKFNINIESNSVKNNINIVNKSINNKKSTCIDASYYKGFGIVFNDCRQVVKCDRKLNKKNNQNKASCLTAGGNSGGNHSDMDLIVTCGRQVGRKKINGKRADNSSIKAKQELELRNDRKTNCLTSVQKDNYLLLKDSLAKNFTIRRLTPKECARLQTIPKWAIKIMLNCGVSNTQLYKMLGNGWTVEVIIYILKHWKNE